MGMMYNMDGNLDHARQAEDLTEHAAQRDITSVGGTPLASAGAVLQWL